MRCSWLWDRACGASWAAQVLWVRLGGWVPWGTGIAKDAWVRRGLMWPGSGMGRLGEALGEVVVVG